MVHNKLRSKPEWTYYEEEEQEVTKVEKYSRGTLLHRNVKKPKKK